MHMQLHDAVRWARAEKKLSQQKLAEMAGIQRRQLATLEKGGNVTLATVRKVLAQLPNLKKFELDLVDVQANHEARKSPDAMQLLASIVAGIVGSIALGMPPTDENVKTEPRNMLLDLSGLLAGMAEEKPKAHSTAADAEGTE